MPPKLYSEGFSVISNKINYICNKCMRKQVSEISSKNKELKTHFVTSKHQKESISNLHLFM